MRVILLPLSLGRSSFCSWAKEELIFCSAINFFTSAVEPSTRIFRVVSPPGGAGTSSPLGKHLCRIGEAKYAAMAMAARKVTEKRNKLSDN